MTTVWTKDRPSEEALDFVIDFFRNLADRQKKWTKQEYGIVEFMYKDLVKESDHDNVPINLRPNQVSDIMRWLKAEGYARQVRVGKQKRPSIWDVRNLLEDPPVQGEPDLDDEDMDEMMQDVPQIKVSLVDQVKQPEAKVEYKVEKKDNVVVLKQINESINDMVGYLQTLPLEMMSELRSLTRDLELADHDVVLQLTKEKEDLKDKVSQLTAELERASATPDYSEHYIYRQRNLILDEVQRILHAPAWSVRQNKEHYNNSIVEKLDNIMEHLNIKVD